MRGGILPLLVALVLGLGGCLKPDAPGLATDDPEESAIANEGADRPSSAREVPIQLSLDAPLAETQEFQGTFELQNHGYPTGAFRSAAGAPPENQHVYDVTQMLPRGVPVFVEAEVNADLGEGDLDLWIRGPVGEFWTSDFDTPFGGYSKVRYLIVHSAPDPVEVVVQYDEVDESASFEYVLRVSFAADPVALPPGVPYAVDTGANAVTLQFEPTGTAETMLYVWNEEDEGILRAALDGGPLTVDLDEGGEIVFMAAEGGSPFRASILADAAAGSNPEPLAPRILSQDIQIGEPRTAQGEGAFTWTFQALRQPLQAGFFAQGPDTALDFAGRLTSPEGVLFDVEFTGGPWLMPGFSFLTDMGDPKLVAGTYEGQVEFGTAAGTTPVQVQDVLVYFAR